MITGLRIPLSKLWPDIRTVGLPVWHREQPGKQESDPYLGFLVPDSAGYVAWEAMFVRRNDKPSSIPFDPDKGMLCLDLHRPGASDNLIRRVATACGWNGTFLPRLRWMGDIWDLIGPGFEVFFTHDPAIRERREILPQRPGIVVPALADLDPTDDTSLDWGNHGNPRIVDLKAIGIVAPYLFELEAA